MRRGVSLRKSYAALFSLCALALAGILLYAVSQRPAIDSRDYAVLVSSDDGRPLAEFYRERRYFIPLQEIPGPVRQAFIAIEDRRFYSHHGFDVKGIIRALSRNISRRAIVEGGSTITQQLAKMILEEPERNFSRKLREMVVTAQLEWHYTKDEILEMYLNFAFFGERTYGIEAAARTYFDKTSGELSIAEAALLAALQKAPNNYSPLRDPRRAEARRQVVLGEMLSMGFISPDEYREPLSAPLPKKTYFQRRFGAPYFIGHLRQGLERVYGDALYTGGFHLSSTIDQEMQQQAESVVSRGVREIEMRAGKGVQAALVALDLKTGAIRAMVGGTDFGASQFNRATMAMRQPGSAFKPFVYMTALEEGMSYDDRVLDSPVAIPDPEKGGLWTPRNSNWEYYGYVSLKTAISLSLNAATVRLAQDIGFEKVRDTAVRFGIRADLPPRPSLALGACDVTLLDLTASYIVFATGRRITPHSYTTITDRRGNVVERISPLSHEVLSPELVDKIKVLLRAVVESGTGGRALAVNRKVYGKTGTTDDYSDAWFVGFDDRLAVGVWVGRDDHTAIGPGESGSSAALPLWVDFMKKADSTPSHREKRSG
ncbi:MAG: PBP1A family penicillin-binding protein [Nitrospirales bacterium]|nr:PBP1A family penicillin-binding protein [Nitrospirales bacterium]